MHATRPSLAPPLRAHLVAIQADAADAFRAANARQIDPDAVGDLESLAQRLAGLLSRLPPEVSP